MDFSTLTSLSGEALTEALSLDFSGMDGDALTAALTERRAEATRLFALTEPTIAEVDVAEAVVASIKAIEGEQRTRAQAATDAADRFAAARQSFGDTSAQGTPAGELTDGEPNSDETVEPRDAASDAANLTDGEPNGDEEGDQPVDGQPGEGSASAPAGAEGDGGEGGDGVQTASAARSTRVKGGAASKVAARTTRPNRAASRQVVITAAADVQGFGAGQGLSDMGEVAKALMSRTKGFPKHNARSAKSIRSANGGAEKIEKFGVASFGLDFPESLTAAGTPGAEYATMQEAIAQHRTALTATMDKDETITASALTAAGWCAPSSIAYSYIADYVVDGLLTMPEVSAPRGGLMVTTGPERSSQGTALDDFGWTQTEAQAQARTVKTFETIVCPEFTDHRLDAAGYGYVIPLLTQKAYPELVADALKFADVLYAHRMNRRFISDIVAGSQAVAFSGYGPSFTDTLEALSLIAVAERRKWNLGENAVMEVKLPLFAKEVFRADMSRRAAVAFDSVSDAQIAKHFSDRRLAVEYVADWQEINGGGDTLTNLVLPGSFTALIYPAGTWVKAVEDVINLSATYDAASLSVNEYLGVFFEQAVMTLKAGYGSSKVSIPINTAGEMGALDLNGLGDALAGGSF